MIRFTLAERHKRYREDANLTIYEVGDKIGKSGKTVSAWECGRGQPDADMLLTLCHLYGINSIAELYGEEVTTPDLETDEQTLIKNYRNLNQEGKEKLLDYSEDLVSGGRYKKSGSIATNG